MLGLKSKSRNRNSFTPDSGLSAPRKDVGGFRKDSAATFRKEAGSVRKDSGHGNSGPSRLWSFLRWTFGLTLSAAVLFGVVLAAFALYRFALSWEYLALQKVEIRGATHFRREDILKATDLQTGKNVFTINISAIENTLSQNPWVTHVAVKRRLPNAFEIEITERVPAFWLLKDGVLQYADKKGAIIAPVEAGNFLSLPTLEILPGGETLQGRVGELMDALHKADLPLDLAAVSTLRLSSAKGLEIVMENMHLTICISPDDWIQNTRRLNSVLRDLARRGELKNTREIWLADGSVWVIMVTQTTAVTQ